MSLFAKKLSAILVLALVLNIFVSSNHFGHKHHTFDPETGNIEHGHDHEGCEHNTETLPDSYSLGNTENEKHDLCGILDLILIQFLKTHLAELVLTFTSQTPYLNWCFEKEYLFLDILSFAPKLSPPFYS